jgi:hypothetical protein
MTLTYQQAITELSNNPSKYTTTQALLELIGNTSADAQGAVTVLYSADVSPAGTGSVQSVGSMEILNGMVANGDDIRMMKF